MAPSASRPIPRDPTPTSGRASSRGQPTPNHRQQEQRPGSQPTQPWATSLDLVWSYSRSQAYYGRNLETSPSFVADARWRGPHDEEDFEDDDDDVMYEDEELYEGEEELTHDSTSGGERLRRPSLLEEEAAAPLWSNDYYNGNKVGAANAAATEATPLIHPDLKRRSTASMRRRSIGQQRRKSSSAGGVSSASEACAPVHLGSSTFGQTLFNCVNALVGVGILSLPLALSFAGLPLGIALFVLAGLITNYTGKLLWKIMMRSDPRLGIATYADIGQYAFGSKSKIAVTVLFCAELWAVSVALTVLFSDSIYALVNSSSTTMNDFALQPHRWPSWTFKLLGFLAVLPTCFMPLRFLSPISIVGIFTTCCLLVIVFVDGTLKYTAPGSLHQPMQDALDVRPQWGKLPLAFGLIMSGFSSHPIIPSLVRDMQDPHRFPLMLDCAYAIATALYLCMGVAGYLMFGRSVSDEITRDLALIPEYPPQLTTAAIALIAAVSVTKFGLALRPVQSTFEGYVLGDGVRSAVRSLEAEQQAESDQHVDVAPTTATTATTTTGPGAGGDGGGQGADGVVSPQPPPHSGDVSIGLLQQQGGNVQTSAGADASAAATGAKGSVDLVPQNDPRQSRSSHRRALLLTWCVRLLPPALVLLTALLVPKFAEVMSFLGSVLAGLSCICGPLAAHLAVFGRGRGRGSSSGVAAAAATTTTTESGRLSLPRRMVEMAIIALAAVMAVMGTVWAFLPASKG